MATQNADEKELMYGTETACALRNFPMTGAVLKHFPDLVKSLAVVKKASALSNIEHGVIPHAVGEVIVIICDEIIAGMHHQHFVVDMIQGGAGTSTNMNANEVIANLAEIRMGGQKGEYKIVHPNDHVNASQSTNDVYPTALRLTLLEMIYPMVEAQKRLIAAFEERAEAFRGHLKVARTQLQDAVPMTVSSEFKSFAVTLSEDITRIDEIGRLLCEVNLGGTAVGTSLNTPEGYANHVVRVLAEVSGRPFVPASDLIEASSDLGVFVTFSSLLKRTAIKLSKISNDLRLLSSGPRAGIGEIILPAVQKGSSIMPGKVNPVIPEVVNQAAYQVIGNDLTVTMAAEAGQLQLNAMEPVVIYNILNSIRLMTNAMNTFTERCVSGIQVNEGRCRELLENSLVVVTSLVPVIGYERATEIANEALLSGHTIRSLVLKYELIDEQSLESILNPQRLIGTQKI